MMILISITDLKLIFRSAYLLYGISLLLLVSVTIFGHTAMGATRWLNLGFIKMQPSEIIKITLVLALARYFHFKEAGDLKHFKNLIIPLLLLALPLVIIIKQPESRNCNHLTMHFSHNIFFKWSSNMEIRYIFWNSCCIVPDNMEIPSSWISEEKNSSFFKPRKRSTWLWI